MTPEEKARRIIEDFIDTHVRYFGDTTKTVLVDELMEALAQPTISDEEIINMAKEVSGSSEDYMVEGIIYGAKWALAKMKGDKC